MSSYVINPEYQWWCAVERPALINRIAFYNNLVLHPGWTGDMTPARLLAFDRHNMHYLNLARPQLALGDRNRRVSVGETGGSCTVKVSCHDASVFIYEGHIFSFEVEKVRCGPRVWVVNQLIWEPKILYIKR